MSASPCDGNSDGKEKTVTILVTGYDDLRRRMATANFSAYWRDEKSVFGNLEEGVDTGRDMVYHNLVLTNRFHKTENEMTNVAMQHTVLAQAEGNGLVEFVYGHDNLKTQYPNMKSTYLVAYSPGDLIHMEVSVGDTGRRSIVSHSLWRDDAATWQVKYADDRQAEEVEYQSALAKTMGVTPAQLDDFEDDDEADELEHEVTTDVVPTRAERRIWISDRDNRLFEVMHKISTAQGLAKMLFVGPSGFGKSSVPAQKALDWNMDFLRWDCATVRDPEEFFGFRGARNGSTQTDDGDNIFTPSLFTQKLEQGNTVILLDELSRLDPVLANVLFPILDDARTINVAGHEVKLGANLIICASINVGYQYTGTWTLDEALRNRFDVTIELGALPYDVEVKVATERTGIDQKIAEQAVNFMSLLRSMAKDEIIEIDASTRTTLALSQLIANGLAVHEAVFYTIVSSLEQSQRTNVINAAGTAFGISFED